MSLADLRKNDKSSVPQSHFFCLQDKQKIEDAFCHVAMTCDELNISKIVKFNALVYLKVICFNGLINIDLEENQIKFYCIKLASKLFKQQNNTLPLDLASYLKFQENDVQFNYFQHYFSNYFNQKLSLLSTPYEFINLAFLKNKISLKQKNASKTIVDFAIIYADSMFKSSQQIAESSIKLAKNGFHLHNHPNIISSL